MPPFLPSQSLDAGRELASDPPRLDLLHKIDLSFSLSDLSSLTPSQLLCVPFHPSADKTSIASANFLLLSHRAKHAEKKEESKRNREEKRKMRHDYFKDSIMMSLLGGLDGLGPTSKAWDDEKELMPIRKKQRTTKNVIKLPEDWPEVSSLELESGGGRMQVANGQPTAEKASSQVDKASSDILIIVKQEMLDAEDTASSSLEEGQVLSSRDSPPPPLPPLNDHRPKTKTYFATSTSEDTDSRDEDDDDEVQTLLISRIVPPSSHRSLPYATPSPLQPHIRLPTPSLHLHREDSSRSFDERRQAKSSSPASSEWEEGQILPLLRFDMKTGSLSPRL